MNSSRRANANQVQLSEIVEQRAPYLSELAEALHVSICHAEPDWQIRGPWRDLNDDAREFYETCAESILTHREAVERYYEIGRPTSTS